jgi:hypothetical protein
MRINSVLQSCIMFLHEDPGIFPRKVHDRMPAALPLRKNDKAENHADWQKQVVQQANWR